MRNPRKILIAVILSSVVFGFAGFAVEAGGDETLPERGVHPLYGEPEPPGTRPLPPVEAAPRVRLEREVALTMSELAGLTVFTREEEPLGVIEDLIVNMNEGRLGFVLVRPAGFTAEPDFSYALGPESLRFDRGRVVADLPGREIRRAPVVSPRELMALVETPVLKDSVYRVGVVDPFPEESYVRVPRPLWEEYRARPPFYAKPGPPPIFRDGYPPEYRGGYPPEHRGGPPPEYRGGPPPEYRGGPPPEYRGGDPPEA